MVYLQIHLNQGINYLVIQIYLTRITITYFSQDTGRWTLPFHRSFSSCLSRLQVLKAKVVPLSSQEIWHRCLEASLESLQELKVYQCRKQVLHNSADCQQISLVGRGSHEWNGSLLHLYLGDRFPIQQVYLHQELNLKPDPKEEKKKKDHIISCMLLKLFRCNYKPGIKTLLSLRWKDKYLGFNKF